jgi:hypothetical protein
VSGKMVANGEFFSNQRHDHVIVKKVEEAEYNPYSYARGQFIPVFFNRQILESTFQVRRAVSCYK